jgi:hypothetical protein
LLRADDDSEIGSRTEEDGRIASPGYVLTSGTARWATIQVGRHARGVNEVARELGCDCHTMNHTLVRGLCTHSDPDLALE